MPNKPNKQQKVLYEQIYNKKNNFSFGNNWKDFLKRISPQQIDNSQTSLLELIAPFKIKGKSFIDVGCGSGLFSLAAHNLNASKVTSLDIDNDSIHCCESLRKVNYKKREWKIIKGSILNTSLIKKLGKYDIVFSWGVLHHTGDMYKAFGNIKYLCKIDTIFILAIYNKLEDLNSLLSGSSKNWLKIKSIYSRSNNIIKKIIEFLYYAWFFIGYIITNRNPFSYIKEYKQRGMNFVTDIKDWLGGYPYEFATSDELINYFSKQGFCVKKIISSNNLGCHQIVFIKHE